MSGSSFWRDLEAQFRALDPAGELRADWDYVAGSGGYGNWRITGTNNTTLRLHFQRLARLAGAAVDETGKQDSLQVWLDTLLKRSPSFEYGDQYVEQNEDGSKGACHIRGRINRLAEASGDLCVELDIEAMEVERRRLPQGEAVTEVSGPAQQLDAPPTFGGTTPVDEVGRDIAQSQPRSHGDGLHASDGRVAPPHAQPSDESSGDLNPAQSEEPALEADEPDPELEELIAEFSRIPTGTEMFRAPVQMMEWPSETAAPSLSRKERLKRMRTLSMQTELDLDSQNEYSLLFWAEWKEQHPDASASPASPTALVENGEPPIGGAKEVVLATQPQGPLASVGKLVADAASISGAVVQLQRTPDARLNQVAGVPASVKKRGRPAKIDAGTKQAALAAREHGQTWRAVAKILYGVTYPTAQQVKNAPNVLNHYKRSIVQPPNKS